MPNPFYEASYIETPAPQYNNQNKMADIYKLLTSSKNPNEIFENIARNNPNMAPIVDLLHKGVSPEEIFKTMCQQRGINPQNFIKDLQNR